MAVHVQRCFSDIKNARRDPNDERSLHLGQNPTGERANRRSSAFQFLLELQRARLHGTE